MIDLVMWPEDWPEYINACGLPCDTLVGPCCCGVCHKEGEFVYSEGVLYRYGLRVS